MVVVVLLHGMTLQPLSQPFAVPYKLFALEAELEQKRQGSARNFQLERRPAFRRWRSARCWLAALAAALANPG